MASFSTELLDKLNHLGLPSTDGRQQKRFRDRAKQASVFGGDRTLYRSLTTWSR
jgi:hypothetical protein